MTPIMVAVICVTAMAVSMCDKEEPEAAALPMLPAMSQDLPPIDIEWQPKTLLENRIVARIRHEVRKLRDELVILAGVEGKPLTSEIKKEWKDKFKETHLKNPRFWKLGAGWKSGWDESLDIIHETVYRSTEITITSISAIIEYKELGDAKTIEDDVDAIIKIRVTFSASPGDNVLEGDLLHRRVCPII
jgi:hypothetical protein